MGNPVGGAGGGGGVSFIEMTITMMMMMEFCYQEIVKILETQQKCRECGLNANVSLSLFFRVCLLFSFSFIENDVHIL